MNVEIVVFDGFEELDALGPLSVLSLAGFDVCLVALARPGQVRGARGTTVVAERALGPAPELLLVPRRRLERSRRTGRLGGGPSRRAAGRDPRAPSSREPARGRLHRHDADQRRRPVGGAARGHAPSHARRARVLGRSGRAARPGRRRRRNRHGRWRDRRDRPGAVAGRARARRGGRRPDRRRDRASADRHRLHRTDARGAGRAGQRRGRARASGWAARHPRRIARARRGARLSLQPQRPQLPVRAHRSRRAGSRGGPRLRPGAAVPQLRPARHRPHRRRRPGVRFEVDGADAAVQLLCANGLDAHAADIVRQAIALHTSGGIAERRAPEIALTRTGIGIDLGRDTGIVDDAAAEAIHRRYPRLQIARNLSDAIADQARGRPDKAPAYSLPAGVLAERDQDPCLTGLERRALAGRWGE